MSRSSDWKHGSVMDYEFWHPQLIKNLSYIRETFNDPSQTTVWETLGHQPRSGELFDMRNPNQPDTTQKLVDWAAHLEHVGVSYYKMTLIRNTLTSLIYGPGTQGYGVTYSSWKIGNPDTSLR